MQEYIKKWNCKIKKLSEKQMIEVWEVSFLVERYEEFCSNKKIIFQIFIIWMSLQLFEDQINFTAIR